MWEGVFRPYRCLGYFRRGWWALTWRRSWDVRVRWLTGAGPRRRKTRALGWARYWVRRAGRDKLTLVLSPSLRAFGLWAEQLVAESTGKTGKGLLPVMTDGMLDADSYQSDRVFVALTHAGEEAGEVEQLEALADRGHPFVCLTLGAAEDLGAEFFRWEFATAVTGAILGVNPFDQPNVAESKANTEVVLEGDVEVVEHDSYLSILVFGPPSRVTDERLRLVREKLERRLGVATTVGYGPRFLHSTGQLHKGGPSTGHFVQVVRPASEDLAVPGMPYTFGRLLMAQAEGDLRALKGRGRPMVRIPDVDRAQASGSSDRLLRSQLHELARVGFSLGVGHGIVLQRPVRQELP